MAQPGRICREGYRCSKRRGTAGTAVSVLQCNRRLHLGRERQRIARWRRPDPRGPGIRCGTPRLESQRQYRTDNVRLQAANAVLKGNRRLPSAVRDRRRV